MDPILKTNVKDISNMLLTQNWDWLHLNSGIERGGKSSFSLWLAWFASQYGLKFPWEKGLPNVFFFEPKISQKMLEIEDRSVVILDEGAENLFSRNAFDREVKKMIQTLMIYGSKNVFLIINIPNWNWIDKYIRVSRARSLTKIRTFPKDFVSGNEVFKVRERGFYEFYSRKQILRASATDDERLLGAPAFQGKLPSFQQFHAKEWAWYAEKKGAFLDSKKKKDVEKKKARAALGDLKLGF